MIDQKIDKDYPQAFPVATATDVGLGMSLRDYFAGQALVGLSVNFMGSRYFDDCYELAEKSYIIADAMLEAREKT